MKTAYYGISAIFLLIAVVCMIGGYLDVVKDSIFMAVLFQIYAEVKK